MMKVWDLMEKLPELYETFQYTLAYDNKKVRVLYYYLSCAARNPVFGVFIPGLTQTGLYSHRRCNG